MPVLARLPFACLLLAAHLADAATAGEWLGSEAARSFRQRVVELALIYGESSGIDPKGYKVEAHTTGALVRGCGAVEVLTSRDGEPLRRETVDACHR